MPVADPSESKTVIAIARLAAWLGAMAIAVIAGALTTNVAMRYFWSASIPGVADLSTLLMIGAAFLGMLEAERSRTHVRVTFLTNSVSRRRGNQMRALGMAVTAATCAVLTFATTQRAIASFNSGEFSSGSVRFPIWPSRALIAVGFALVALYTLAHAAYLASHWRRVLEPNANSAHSVGGR